MPTAVITELHYLPSVAYFTLLANADKVLIDLGENYQKQSYRNRAQIVAANKVDTLTVPVIKGNSRQSIAAVKIDYQQKWLAQHWRAIQSAYGKAPFFEYYAPELKAIYDAEPTYLADLNFLILTICRKFMGIIPKLDIVEGKQSQSETGAEDYRGMIHPKTSWESYSFFKPLPYYQIFGKAFEPNMSIIDLLFCEGPNAKAILHQSAVRETEHL